MQLRTRPMTERSLFPIVARRTRVATSARFDSSQERPPPQLPHSPSTPARPVRVHFSKVQAIFVPHRVCFGSGEVPAAVISPDRSTVAQGNTATLTCQVTGFPEPTVTWRRIGSDLGANVRIQGNVLRIPTTVPSDRGLYVCEVANIVGRAQASAILEIESQFIE